MGKSLKDSQIKEKFLKRRNFKARNNIKTKIDTTEQQKIKLELGKDVSDFQIKLALDKDGALPYDNSNTLAIPSTKRRTKKIVNAAPIKILSKKQRKRLEKIVSSKEKKAKHFDILQELEEFHAKNKKMPAFTSLQATQTIGRKKYLKKGFAKETADALANNKQIIMAGGRQLGCSTISSSVKRKKQQDALLAAKRHKPMRDPSIVDGSISSSEVSSDSEDEITEVIKSEPEDDASENIDDSQKEITESKVEVKEEESPEVMATSEAPPGAQITSTVLVEPEDRLPSNFVVVERKPEFEESRNKLPILSEEQSVMEAIKENMMVVIVGETGSGKTTQVPQFLYEAGYASGDKIIGVTQPRRVAARSMSERVAKEMNLSQDIVSYQIRYEGNVTDKTKVKFMTDGVLLKEFESNYHLSKYSAIIIDEAHERSVNSDVLIGILSRIVVKRHKKCDPLKLIIMSATLRVEDFTENAWLVNKLPCPPPVLRIEGRMYDVTVHYEKETKSDYVGAAYNTVCKIHNQLPEGAILVFLTGQEEIFTLMRKLKATYPSRPGGSTTAVSAYRSRKEELRKKRQESKDKNLQPSDSKTEEELESGNLTKKLLDMDVGQFAAAASGITDNKHLQFPDHDEAADFLDEPCNYDLEDVEFDQENEVGGSLTVGASGSDKVQPLYVLPLFSQLDAKEQLKVFQPPPAGTRLCVIATNVAETSLTIPDVKYVVDSGKTKAKVFDQVTGVSMFDIPNCSQASADQRKGRAGRVAPGHCYRLYSAAVFNEMKKFDMPEILCRPIDDVVLLIKGMKRLPVVNFPFPTPPDRVQVKESLRRLKLLGALEEKAENMKPETSKPTTTSTEESHKPVIVEDKSRITQLGESMNLFPVAPRYAKMLCQCVVYDRAYGMWPYAIALVAALTVQEVLIEMPLDSDGDTFDLRRKEVRARRLKWSGQGPRRLMGDLMVLLMAVIEADKHDNSPAFCDANYLRRKGLLNIQKLRLYLTKEINRVVKECHVPINANNRSLPKLQPPSDQQCILLQQIVLSGSIDRVARRVDAKRLSDPEEKAKWKHAYRTVDMADPVYLPSSSVFKKDRKNKPEWIAYQDIFETHKMFMRGVIAIEPEWLVHFCPSMCNFGDPHTNPAPYYDAAKDAIMCHRDASYGRADWTIPMCRVPHPVNDALYGRFAYNLLQGNVIDTFGHLKNHLIDHVCLLRPLSLKNKRQKEEMIRMLHIYQVKSKARLLAIWRDKKMFLWDQYKLWLVDQNPGSQQLIKRIWPPLPKEKNEWLA